MPGHTPEIVFSNQNILDPDPRTNLGRLFHYTPERIGEFAAAAGLDGVQWMPMVDMVPGHGLRAIKQAVDAGKLEVNSWHQAWRHTPGSRRRDMIPGEEPDRGSWAARVAINTPGVGRIVFGPTVMGSAKAIGRAGRKLGRNEERDVVFYPHANPNLDHKQIVAAEAGKAIIQPHDKEARKVGATTLRGFDYQIRDVRRYDGYALGTGWIHRPSKVGPKVISTIEESVPYLASHSPEVHLEIGRWDQGRTEASMTELRNALRGDYTGEIGFMLGVVREVGKVERVVIEAPFSSVAQAAEVTTDAGLISAYADIGEGFRSYWGQEPEPVLDAA